MNIVVLVKQVPDTTEIRVDKATGTMIRAGVPSIINPDDLAGIEEALKIKDARNAHITAVTMGPPQAVDMLRECFARGVDAGVLITDKAFAGADTWATSNTLSAALKKIPYDLIIAGRQAIDGDTAQVGPQVAERLSLPQVTYVEEIRAISDASIIVKKACEHESQILEADLPCVLTTLSSMNVPRYMNCEDIVTAFDKEIKIFGFNDLDLTLKQVGLAASPTNVLRTFTKDVSAQSEVFTLPATEAAAKIMQILKDKQLLTH